MFTVLWVILLIHSKKSKWTGSWLCTDRKKTELAAHAKVNGNKNHGEEILPHGKIGNWGKSFCLGNSQENSCSLLHAEGTISSYCKDTDERLPNPLNISLLLWVAPKKRTRQRPLTSTYFWEINFSGQVTHSRNHYLVTSLVLFTILWSSLKGV